MISSFYSFSYSLSVRSCRSRSTWGFNLLCHNQLNVKCVPAL